MEKTRLDKDIDLCCVKADTFPEGILMAHQTLHDKISFSSERKYFGLSRPEKGEFVYWAAAEVLGTDNLNVEKMGVELKTIQRGDYISLTISGYRKEVEAIGKAFDTLIAQPGIDPQGYCVEWYLEDNDTVKCMVRLK